MHEKLPKARGQDLPVTLVVGPPGSGKTTFVARSMTRYQAQVAVLFERRSGSGAIDPEILRSMLSFELPSEQARLYGEQSGLFLERVMISRELQCVRANGFVAHLIEMVAGGDIVQRVGQMTNCVEQTTGCYLNGVVAVLPTAPSKPDEFAVINSYLSVADVVFCADIIAHPGETMLGDTADLHLAGSRPSIIGENDLHLIFGKLRAALGRPSAARCKAGGPPAASPSTPLIISMGFVQAMDPIKVTVLFNCLGRHYGRQIHRAKGLLDLAGSEQKLIVQGAGASFRFEVGTTWQAREPRQSTLCFWGQDLIAERLSNGFRSCQVDRILH